MILLIDSQFICYQAHFALDRLTNGSGEETEVIFGFLSRINYLAHLFKTNEIVFCWDSKHSLRRKVRPEYKKQRRDSKDYKKLIPVFRQMESLRTDILPSMGFANIFHHKGLEADDLMAHVCRSTIDQIVMVTADNDMFQCLASNISMYNPSSKKKSKTITREDFCKSYGITPSMWWKVKAIAGCKSDNVQGVRGVAEKTAIKYLLGKTTPTQTRKIRSHKKLILENVKLVKLPFDEPVDLQLKQDGLMWEKFAVVFEELGFESFLNDETKWRQFASGRFEGERREIQVRVNRRKRKG
jgi:5'-3' exonuclease